MALADTGCAASEPDCSVFTVVLRALLTTIDGVGQAGGLLAIAEGAFMPTQYESNVRRKRLPPLRLKKRSEGIVIRPAPYTARGALGLGLVGAF